MWCHVSGIDLIRDDSGQAFILEDNVRCPSGVSYVVENRQLLKRTFPRIFNQLGTPGRRLPAAPVAKFAEVAPVEILTRSWSC